MSISRMNILNINTVNMSRFPRYLEVLRYQLGMPGLLGLLGLIGSLMLLLSSVMPAQQALQQKKNELAWLSKQPQIPQQEMQATKLNDEQALQQFYQQFPPVSTTIKTVWQSLRQSE